MYTKHILFLYFFYFSLFILKNKQNKDRTTKQKQTNNMKAWKKDAYAWRHDRKMQMHAKKSFKESPTLDRKN